MVRAHRTGRGFTLVEMLVVIGIIAVLAAILFPVFATAKRKANEAKTHAQMTSILAALKEYHRQKGFYPPPPQFDGTRYIGGLSVLYPDFLDEKSVLFCPMDVVAGMDPAAVPEGYCSYNGVAVAPKAGNWALDPNKITYNYFGLSDGSAACGSIPFGFDVGPVNQGTRAPTQTGWAGLWDAASPPGTASRKMPRLMNRYAPDNTIAFECIYTSKPVAVDKEQWRIFARTGGTIEKVATYVDPADPAAAQLLSKMWITQN